MLYQVHVEQSWHQDVIVEAEDEMDALTLAEEAYDFNEAVAEVPYAKSVIVYQGPKKDINYEDPQ